MIHLDESMVDSAAPNAAAIKNGRKIAGSGKLLRRNKDADETILFGECSGSGSSNYYPSCDFQRADKPVYRCTCPSRQWPCKHALGLMYSFVQGGAFQAAEIPPDVAGKREKVAVQTEKRQERANQPVKVNAKALSKKVAVQLEALDLLETLVHDLARAGLANLNAQSAKRIEAHAKQLRDAYLPGAQSALHELTRLFYRDDGYELIELGPSEREGIYSAALDHLDRLATLVRRGRESLQARLADPDLALVPGSGIAAWLGHAWKLRELKDAGLVAENRELLQLAFRTRDERAREELVDTGVWVDLASGRVLVTRTYRPYHAARFIRSDDSVFHVVEVPELCEYPGDLNPRVRWEESRPRSPSLEDYQRARDHGRDDLKGLLKEVRNQLKDPLAGKTPLALLRYARIARSGEEFVLVGTEGTKLVLGEDNGLEEPATCHLLRLLPPELLEGGGTLLGRFHHDLDSRTLRLKPLTFLDGAQVLRLTF